MKDFFTAFDKRLELKFEREIIHLWHICDQAVKEKRAQISRFLWFFNTNRRSGWLKSHRKKDKLDRVILKYFSPAACMQFSVNNDALVGISRRSYSLLLDCQRYSSMRDIFLSKIAAKIDDDIRKLSHENFDIPTREF